MIRENLLPIEVKVLIRNHDNYESADISNDYSNIGDMKTLFSTIEAEPFNNITNKSQGIHLHFIIPDKLRIGQVSENQEDAIQFPDLPDHWLVTRMWTQKKDFYKKLRIRRFLVEGNCLQEQMSEENHNVDSCSFPLPNDPEQPYRFLGRSSCITDILPKIESKLDSLNVCSSGSPYFTALYPYCNNVFGFYDDMTDENGRIIEDAKLSYLICGWHSNPKTEEEKSNIYHSMVVDLTWCDQNDPLESNGNTDKNALNSAVKIAVGNSSAEAISAFSRGSTNKGQEETMKVAIRDLADIPNELNGMKTLHSQFHEDCFENYSSRKYLKSKEKKPTEDSKMAIREINNLQNQIRRTEQVIKYYSRNLFDYWLGYLYSKENDYRVKEQDCLQICKGFIKKNIAIVKKERLNLLIYEEKVSCLKHMISSFDELQGFEFWKPNNPVVLLANLGRDFTFGYDGRYTQDKSVSKRSHDEIIKSLTLESNEVTKLINSVEIKSSSVINSPIENSNIPYVCEKLEAEVILLSSTFKEYLAYLALKLCKDNIQEEFAEIELAKLIEKLQEIPLALERKHDSSENLLRLTGFSGKYPSLMAINYDDKKSMPILLEWSVKYYPDNKLNKAFPTLDNWELGDNDFKYIGNYEADSKEADSKEADSKEESESYILLSGRNTITPHIVDILNKTISKQKDTEVEQAGEYDLLSQFLSDFNDGILMRRHRTPQTIYSNTDKEMAKEVAKYVSEFSDKAAINSAFFSPIRGGYMTIHELRVIDTFGKYKKIEITGDISIAKEMKMKMNDDKNKNKILLTPRILQASRLNVELQERREGEHIWGWIVPNHFDGNLTIYSPEGVLLGYLQSTDTIDDKIRWISAPGTRTLLKDLPSKIKEFVRTFLEFGMEGGEVLIEFLKYSDSALTEINPVGSDVYFNVSSFVGRPLALVSANIWLELCGPEEKFKVPELFEDDLDTPFIKSSSLSKTLFPIRIGEFDHHNDGMVGFFDNRFSVFHTTYFSKEIYNYKFFNDDVVMKLHPSFEPQENIINMLIDPMADVHITTGILPQAKIKLSPEEVNLALENIHYTMFAAPLISTETIFAPYPNISGAKWNWITSKGEMKEIRKLEGSEIIHSNENLKIHEGWFGVKRERKEEL